MNSVQLVGRLATEVDLKEVSGGSKVCSFILAVDRNAEEADFPILPTGRGGCGAGLHLRPGGNGFGLRRIRGDDMTDGTPKPGTGMTDGHHMSDDAAGRRFGEHAECMAQHGFRHGYSNGDFGRYGYITRAQIHLRDLDRILVSDERCGGTIAPVRERQRAALKIGRNTEDERTSNSAYR